MSAPAMLRIGTRAEGNDAFELPVDLVTQTLAILGIRSSGKTVTATVIVEEALRRGFQVVVVDPTDVWFGLKSSADGQAPGFPAVVLGGAHGDLPLAAEAGAAVADFVVERRVPVILSLRHLRKTAQRRFVMEFAEQLYFRKGEPEHRTPLLVVIDEASQFVPQRVQGDVARLVGAIENLVRQGRASGFGVALVDQRPASVNKDVLTQLEVLVCHRVTAPQDRKALREWIDQHDTEGHRERFLDVLAALPTGRAWFWSPYLAVFELVQVRMRETFDSSRTPKPGEAPPVPETLADVDLEEIRGHLQEAIAAIEANDPKTLQRRIRELEGELRAARSRAPAPADPEFVERAVREAVAAHDRKWAESLREPTRMLGKAMALVRELDETMRAIGFAETPEWPESAPVRDSAPEVKRPAEPPRETTKALRDSTRNVKGASDVSGPQQRMLDALAWFAALGLDPVDRRHVAVFSGQSPKSSGFRKNLSTLSSAELIEYKDGGAIALTGGGTALATPAERPRTLAELHAAWLGYLSGPQCRMLEILIRQGGGAVSRDDLARWTGQSPKSSGFRKNLSTLSSLGLLRYPSGDTAAATELLYPEGL